MSDNTNYEAIGEYKEENSSGAIETKVSLVDLNVLFHPLQNVEAPVTGYETEDGLDLNTRWESIESGDKIKLDTGYTITLDSGATRDLREVFAAAGSVSSNLELRKLPRGREGFDCKTYFKMVLDTSGSMTSSLPFVRTAVSLMRSYFKNVYYNNSDALAEKYILPTTDYGNERWALWLATNWGAGTARREVVIAFINESNSIYHGGSFGGQTRTFNGDYASFVSKYNSITNAGGKHWGAVMGVDGGYHAFTAQVKHALDDSSYRLADKGMSGFFGITANTAAAWYVDLLVDWLNIPQHVNQLDPRVEALNYGVWTGRVEWDLSDIICGRTGTWAGEFKPTLSHYMVECQQLGRDEEYHIRLAYDIRIKPASGQEQWLSTMKELPVTESDSGSYRQYTISTTQWSGFHQRWQNPRLVDSNGGEVGDIEFKEFVSHDYGTIDPTSGEEFGGNHNVHGASWRSVTVKIKVPSWADITNPSNGAAIYSPPVWSTVDTRKITGGNLRSYTYSNNKGSLYYRVRLTAVGIGADTGKTKSSPWVENERKLEPTGFPLGVTPDFVFDADYMQLIYSFTNGRDLDTITRIVQPDIGQNSWNSCLGWDRASSRSPYIWWAGDNTGTGFESCLVDLKKLKAFNPSNKLIKVSMRAWWYKVYGSNGVSMACTFWKGGTMVGPSNFQWVNPTASDSLQFSTDSVDVPAGDSWSISQGSRTAVFYYDLNTTSGYFSLDESIDDTPLP